MNQIVSLVTVSALLAFRAAAAEPQGQLDGSRTLFSVLAAVNAAGYDADLASPANHPLRQLVRQEIAAKKLPVVDDLRYFLGKHRPKDPTQELSQYISFALSVKGPPDFEYKFRKIELPPDVEALQGFAELMVRFDRDAEIEELFERWEC